MDRQQRVLFQEDPPRCMFVVDVLSLYREVGSPAVMTEQLRHLIEVAELPHFTMIVMPAIAHPCNEAGFIISDDAVYSESAAVGGVHQDQVFDTLSQRFDTLRGESYRVSESVGILRRLEAVWARGERPLTAVLTAETAWRWPTPRVRSWFATRPSAMAEHSWSVPQHGRSS
jgi:hypothetical protein